MFQHQAVAFLSTSVRQRKHERLSSHCCTTQKTDQGPEKASEPILQGTRKKIGEKARDGYNGNHKEIREANSRLKNFSSLQKGAHLEKFTCSHAST